MARTAWALLAIALLVAGALTFPSVGDPVRQEPTFEGRSLRSWLTLLEADPASTNVARVLHELGPQALRLLVRDLDAADPFRWRASLAINLLGPAAAPV